MRIGLKGTKLLQTELIKKVIWIIAASKIERKDAMPDIYECVFPMRYSESDAHDHVNHANCSRYMQEAAFDASANVGYDFATYEEMIRHWLVPASSGSG